MLAQVKAALVAALDTAIDDAQVSGYVLSDPTPPTLQILQGPVQFDTLPNGRPVNARGGDTWTLTLQGFLATPGDIAAQQFLDELMEPHGARSIKQIIEKDTTLGGLIINVTVLSCTGIQQYSRPDGAMYLGAEWALRVSAEGGGA